MAVKHKTPAFSSPFKRFVGLFLMSLVAVMSVVSGPMPALAQAPNDQAPAAQDAQAQYEQLSESLTKAIAAEKALLEELIRRREELEHLENSFSREISAIRLQISAFGNLLSLATASLEDLDKAQGAIKQIGETAAQRLKELTERQADLNQRLKALADQKSLNEKQSQDLKAQGAALPVVRTLLEQLKEAHGLLQQKEKLLQGLREKVGKLSADWSQIQQEAGDLQEKLAVRLAERKKEELFRRSRNPLSALSVEAVREEVERLALLSTRPLSPGFWMDQGRFLWKTGGILLITSLLVFAAVEVVLFRLRSLCQAHASAPLRREKVWYCITVRLMARSLPLAGAVIFAYGYGLARGLYTTFPPLQILVQALLLWLLTSWGIHFLALLKEHYDSPLASFVRPRVRLALSLGRWLVLSHLCLQAVLGGSSTLLLLYRFALEVLFLAWALALGRGMVRRASGAAAEGSPRARRLATVSAVGLYTVAGAGVLLELAGYGLLATVWYAGWGRTAAVALWLFVCYKALGEWEDASETAAAFAAGDEDTRRSFQWLLVRILWVVWLFSGVVGTLVAWGAKQAVILTFFRILDTPVPIGGLTFRLSGLVYALLILAVTHAGSRLFKNLLRSRVFRHSGLEVGLQESITTISGYVLWFLGVLAALNALGFSGTSLTVAFGALGVGLGFGLQNIFNNFISGLILLFERPIQVGDAIEVDGIWGEVKKINVRSTVIQTWDNASLIIPNSEFISGRVTNWSFKDMRLRRNIDVGVAYGSDVELVRRTLLEVADKHPRVFKKPEPSVLFLDFGDSALLFRLRVWTTIDACIQVETDIRFEIDRLFRERGIEIPFPQRDIHIRSVVSSFESAVEGGRDRRARTEKEEGEDP
ncbi:Small-conductance mechanosensitive channel [Desulfacinum infernum DSM 9756]|uniref:Small-conductance mechanosensitive channel n=1 Tax=Desulfacinum infernum DSM 9756 TaxID=1121391 RepID=A0A1M5D8B8_9BACT|nr:mechanosensitive ion channel domain-containing protein [Desulfacinum infernum]SHF62912.1 Small-conductance mechanosensitive channel [Desulfacinum infernum DSM 9756]